MNPPFYVLSSGDESSDGTTPNTSLSGSSHDTSRAKYHIQDVETFATDLNNAAKSAFPNRGRSRYETVNACLIRWEEDELLVEPELTRLDHIFQAYGFATKKWQIPTKNSHLDLMMRTGEFIRDADNDKNLFIVYYGGHGKINSERQAEWLCTRDSSSTRVHWSAIQTLFAEAQSDVLILLDACAAASATARSLHGSMEAIMACGFESKAPPPGEHSFTNTLIDVLEEWIDRRSFSASCLHAEILSQLKLKENKKGREGRKLEWCVTPIHINCTQDSKAPSIELCRRNILPRPSSSTSELEENQSADIMDLDFDNLPSSPHSSLLSLAPSGHFRVPHVLISVALEESQPDLDVKKAARWLENIPLLVKWAKVEAVFQSYSTLLILSVSVPVWNMLPDHPACSFIGYVTSSNLVNIPPSVEEEPVGGLASNLSTKDSAIGDEEEDRFFTVPKFSHWGNQRSYGDRFITPSSTGLRSMSTIRHFGNERPSEAYSTSRFIYSTHGDIGIGPLRKPSPPLERFIHSTPDNIGATSLSQPNLSSSSSGSFGLNTPFPPHPRPPPIDIRERGMRYRGDRLQPRSGIDEAARFAGDFNRPRDAEKWDRYFEGRLDRHDPPYERGSTSVGGHVRDAPAEDRYREKGRGAEYDT